MNSIRTRLLIYLTALMLLLDFGGKLVQAETLSIPGPDQAGLPLTFLPAPGFQMAAMVVDGVSGGGGHNSYTLSNVSAVHAVQEVFEQASDTFADISADHNLQVFFAGITSSISASSSVGGSIYPSGNLDVPTGSSRDFRFVQAPGYHLNRVLIDSEPVVTASPYSFINANFYTFRLLDFTENQLGTFRSAHNVSFPGPFPQEARGNKEYALLHQPVLAPKSMQVAMVFSLSPQWESPPRGGMKVGVRGGVCVFEERKMGEKECASSL